MWCALVFYLVVTIFVDANSLPELCVFEDYKQKAAHCGSHDVEYTFDFIPTISQDISYIDLLGQPLKQLPYNGFRNLSSQNSISTIRLRHCQISHIDAGALFNLHNLTIIDLSHNDINQIDIKLFYDTKLIKVIDMAYNKIEVLPNGLFTNLTLLEEVCLHHNKIRQVEKFSFKNTPSLRIIDLNNNQIQYMNMLFKDKLDNLTNLSLYGNPWKCNCKLVQLYEFHIKFNQLNQHALVCEKPSTLHGRKWNDISRDEFVCSSEVAMSAQDSFITSIEPVTTTELVVTNSTIIKLDKDEGMNKDAEPVNIEEETITDEPSEKPVTKQKPEIGLEISDITQKPVIIDETQVPEVEEDTTSSEMMNSEPVTAEPDTETEKPNTVGKEPIITDESAIEELTTIIEPIKTAQEPVDNQIVTTEMLFTKYEGADRNLANFLNDLKWMAWTLFSVAMICLLIVVISFGCAAKFTFTSLRRRMLSRTDEHIEETSGLMYFQTTQQENC